MQIATIVGHATATLKHPSINGWKLLIAQPWTLDEKPDGEPILVIDSLGAGLEDRVIVCNDGAGTRALMGQKNSPVRWFVMGICDNGMKELDGHAHR
jgi:ethanolamine utilization protein EutN